METMVNDIVYVGGRVGFIWMYDGELQVGWDMQCLSCEDSTPLSDLLLDKYSQVKIVGQLKR